MSAASMVPTDWSDDLDRICGYLSRVDGIDGAVILAQDGLPLAWGEESGEEFDAGAPWMLQNLLDAIEFCTIHAIDPVEEQLSLSTTRFWLCRKIGSSYLIVQGAKGSYELFQGRIDRCAQMALQALRQRRLAE